MLHQQGTSHTNGLQYASPSNKYIGQASNEHSGYTTTGSLSSSQEQLSSSSSSVSTVKLDNNLYTPSTQPNDSFNKFTTVYSSTTVSGSLPPAHVNHAVYNTNPYHTTSASFSPYQNYPLSENVSYDYYSGGNLQSSSATHQHNCENGWQQNSSSMVNPSSSQLQANNFLTSFQGHQQAITNNIPNHQNQQYQMVLHGMQ